MDNPSYSKDKEGSMNMIKLKNAILCLCYAKHYFCAGTNEQFCKMLSLVEEGLSGKTIATIIWVNTPNVDRLEIENAVREVYAQWRRSSASST